MESTGEVVGGDAEGGGCGSESGLIVVETPAPGLEKTEFFYVVKEVIGFVLYMHQQIPSLLQNLEDEFYSLKEERKSLEESLVKPTEQRPAPRRIHNFKLRGVKQGIKKLEKLMFAISQVLSSLELMLDKVSTMHGLLLVLGGSILRPRHVYELSLSNGAFTLQTLKNSIKSKLAEALSRKVIRALISEGAGENSFTGPMKLFLLVKAPAAFNLPQYFVPKRDFRYNKKRAPLRLRIDFKISDQIKNDSCLATGTANPAIAPDSSSADIIWFQCRHVVKGLVGRSRSAECQ